MSPRDLSAASLLDTMTGDTAKRKGVGLTPVGMERPLSADDVAPSAPDTTPAATFDTEGIPPSFVERLMDARREAQRVVQVLVELEHDLNRSMGANMEADYFAIAKGVFGDDIVEVATPDGSDAAAGEAFAEDFIRKSKAAKAATFPPRRSTSEAVSQPAEQWACPEHGAGSTIDTVSPRGRHHRKCTECKEFEK
jgi:hypothetical protein